MGKQALTLVFELGSIDVASILRGIEDPPARSGAKFGPVKLDGQTEKDFENVVQQVRKRNLRGFNLLWHPYEFEFGQVTNSKFQFLLINSVQQSEISWDDWADPFVARPGFVMGWVADTEYQFWQNAHDPLEYRAAGRSFDHLPMKSNALPYPLEQTIIDTSANPGRRLVRKGYYEAVGALMWLGEPFWALTGANRTLLEHSDWLQVSSPVSSMIRVQAAEELFKEATGRSRECQENLRALLFPKTVSV